MLEAQQKAIDRNPRMPFYNLNIDVGALWARRPTSFLRLRPLELSWCRRRAACPMLDEAQMMLRARSHKAHTAARQQI